MCDLLKSCFQNFENHNYSYNLLSKSFFINNNFLVEDVL